jgi:hypothetical protein
MSLEINGREYGWSQLSIASSFSNGVIDEAVSIKYGEKTEQANIYGRGSLPVAVAPPGKTEFTVSLKVLQSFIVRLQAALPPGKRFITRMPPFSLIVSYQEDDGRIVTHRILNFRVTEVSHEMKQGDLNMEIELPGIASLISYE